MCEYKSFIVVRPLADTPARILFYEGDSHEDMIKRAGLRDSDQHMQHFVRVECRPPFAAVRVDERECPAWYTEDRAAIEARVIALALIIAPLDADYEAKRAPLYADYEAKRDTLDADYEAKCDTLYADYEAKCDTLYADYRAKRAPLDADYEAKRDTLYADYEAKCDTLYADYRAKRAPLYADFEAKRDTLDADYEAKLSAIVGYLPPVSEKPA